MKFNISCPETGRNKIIELQNEEKMNDLIDKRIGHELEGELISDLFDGYIFKIQGGYDKDGFAMKNGVLTQGRKRIMLQKGAQSFHFRRGYHRTGTFKRKLVRGCIISPEIKVLNLKVIKVGEKPIPGLTEVGCELPKRLGPKKATKILKEYGLLEIYNKKKTNAEERRTLRYMITKFAAKREVKTANGKVYTKRPKIQRLITPIRLRRKRFIKKIKDERRKDAEASLKRYREDLAGINRQLKKQKIQARNQKAKRN